MAQDNITLDINTSIKAPKYNVKDVIDLRFSNDTMPDRIYIRMVYKRDVGTEWMYEVLSEKASKGIYMTESQIDKLKSNKDGACYQNPMIIDMYKNGFRFCGNSKKDTATNRAHSMIGANYIKHIILADAFDKHNNPMPGYLGLWVQYNTVIDEFGLDNINAPGGYYFIK